MAGSVFIRTPGPSNRSDFGIRTVDLLSYVDSPTAHGLVYRTVLSYYKFLNRGEALAATYHLHALNCVPRLVHHMAHSESYKSSPDWLLSSSWTPLRFSSLSLEIPRVSSSPTMSKSRAPRLSLGDAPDMPAAPWEDEDEALALRAAAPAICCRMLASPDRIKSCYRLTISSIDRRSSPVANTGGR